MSFSARSKADFWQGTLIFLIRIYQHTLSYFIGGHCRFYPTCSSYAIQAIRNYGAMRGSWLTARRLLRCHPWHLGGIDLVPERVLGNGVEKLANE